MELPQEFIETVSNVFGDEGRAWLPTLPDILQQCRKKWDLPIGTICPTLRMNYIEFTTMPDGTPVALKVGVHNPELFTEMEALQTYNGRGAVNLVDADRTLGAILIQRLQPGTMLCELDDDRKATELAASIMHELPVAVPAIHTMPLFTRWVEGAFHDVRTNLDPTEQMPRILMERAEQALAEILHNSSGDVVLHGDLHHENILFDEQRGWIAIDPKGVVGPPILELGRFMQNYLPKRLSGEDWLEKRAAMVHERVAIFSHTLGYTPEEVAASALVDCILSHCWGLEDEVVSPQWADSLTLGWLLCDIAGLT